VFLFPHLPQLLEQDIAGWRTGQEISKRGEGEEPQLAEVFYSAKVSPGLENHCLGRLDLAVIQKVNGQLLKVHCATSAISNLRKVLRRLSSGQGYSLKERIHSQEHVGGVFFA